MTTLGIVSMNHTSAARAELLDDQRPAYVAPVSKQAEWTVKSLEVTARWVEIYTRQGKPDAAELARQQAVKIQHFLADLFK